HVYKSVLGANAQFRVALLRNPVPYVRNPMPRVDGGRAPGESRRQSIPLPRLGRVDAQFEKSDRFLLLSVAPYDSGNAEHQSQERQNLPLQHATSSSISERAPVATGLSSVIVSGAGANLLLERRRCRACRLPGVIHRGARKFPFTASYFPLR